MTLVPGLELLALRNAPPPGPAGAPVLIALEPARPAPMAVAVEDADEDLDVVEVRSPLTIVLWAAAVVGAGLATVAALLLLGPLFGTVAVLATVVSIVRRYEQAGDDELDVSG
jgi:hypothetical protein